MNEPQQRFSQLFVIIDPTTFVQTAYLRAESIARRNGARMTIYCCIDRGNEDDPHVGESERQRVVRNAIERLVDPALAERAEVLVESSDNWRRTMVDAAVRSNSDLIVKQASRHSLVGRVFSATADWMLLREAHQPVMLTANRSPDDERRVLAAIKLKAEDDHQQALNAKIVELSHYLSDAVGFEMHAATAWRGDDVFFDRQHFADFCGLPRNRVHAVEGAAHVAVAKAAEQVGADTIVIGNPEKSETAQRLIDHVHADLLVLPAVDLSP